MQDRPSAATRAVRRLAGLLPGRRARRELEEARRATRRLQQRLESLRPREDLGYLFVVTYGRSGSTLLQGVLNSIPGYQIRGENRQALRHLHQFHRTVVRERALIRRRQRRRNQQVGGTTTTHPWYGLDNVPVRAALLAARRLALDTLLRPDPETRVTGYKEIRWSASDAPEFVAWLRQVFPGARFVVNTRDLDAVARSKWWADRPDARQDLATRESRILALAEELGDAAFRVHYDDWVADPGALRPLFAWLGEDFDEARVRAVLSVRHSY